MTNAYPKITGWIGYDGGDILVTEGSPIEVTHPVVAQRPDIFDVPVQDAEATPPPAAPEAPPKRGRGRPPGSRNKPRPAADV